MRKRKRTEVTIEKDEVVVIRRLGGGLQTVCAACRKEVRMLTPEQAADLAGVNVRNIYRWIEANQLHHVESAGRVFVCPNSLPIG